MIPIVYTPSPPHTHAATTGGSVLLPSCDAATFTEPLARALPPDIQIRALDATAHLGLPVPASSLPPTARGPPPAAVDVCLLTVNYTHRGEGDAVTTWVGLPLRASSSSSGSGDIEGGDGAGVAAAWNGRFLMNGGGGWLAGSADGVVSGVASGYASAATDGGHEGGGSNGWPDVWGLVEEDEGDGEGGGGGYRVNWPALEDFGSRALVEAVGIGKRATEVYFGEGPRYSYWNGCSTGGRQGHGELNEMD